AITDGADLAQWCAARTASDVMYELQAAGIPAGRVQNGDDLTDRDEQLAARNAFGTLKSGVFGERPYDRFPGAWSGSNLEPYQCAPSYLGEHNFEVLSGLCGASD